MAEYSDIINGVDSSLDSFDKAALKAQKRIMEKIQLLAKDLDVDSAGNIKITIANLRKIANMKAEISKVVVDDRYKDAVTKLCESFETIYNRQQNYYKEHFQEATLSETAAKKQKLLRQLSVDNTIEGLTGAGVNAQITDKLTEMLQRSVTSGARWTDMVKEMKAYLDPDGDGTGAFAKYAKTYATTAMGQFTGQNNKLMTDALDAEWYMYVGSNIETSREFCQHLTKKKYVHVSEIPEILKGHIDGHKCERSATTGLPLGMIKGTTPENFQVNVGGWNCRHQLLPIAEEAVPKNVRDKFAEKNKEEQEKNLYADYYRFINENKAWIDETMRKAKVIGKENDLLDLINGQKDLSYNKYVNSFDRLDVQISREYDQYRSVYNADLKAFKDLADSASSLGYQSILKSMMSDYSSFMNWDAISTKEMLNNEMDRIRSLYRKYEKEITEQKKNDAKKTDEQSPKADPSIQSIKSSLKDIVDAIKKWNIEERPVEKLGKELTNEEIIDRLGGGDMTKGSCSSLAFAFAGNKAGFDVLDFRDGTSRQFFSNGGNIMKIARNVGGFVAKHTSDIQKAKMMFATIREGKLYYFTCGAHAAIVRKNNGILEYLELQSRTNNGWHQFTNTTLKYRFGAKQSHSTWGMKYETEDCIIDIDLLRDSEDFRNMLGYINTAPDKQRKGSAGTIK